MAITRINNDAETAWLEHRDALKRNGPNYTSCIEWALEFRCDERAIFFFSCELLWLGAGFFSFLLYCCCCVQFLFASHSDFVVCFCIARVSLVLFVSLVRFLVSLIASRYSMPMQNNTHSRGQTYMYIKFRVINKRTNVRTNTPFHTQMNMNYKKKRTNRIYFFPIHTRKKRANIFTFPSSSALRLYGKNFGGYFFYSIHWSNFEWWGCVLLQ